LTAQELRDRESGRFLRRRRAQAGPPQTGRRGPDTRRDLAGPSSPSSGGSIAIDSPITIKKLANALAVKENLVLQQAMKSVGFGININSAIDEETAMLLAQEFGVELDIKSEI